MKSVLLIFLLGLGLLGCTQQPGVPSEPIPIRVSAAVEGAAVSRGVALDELPLSRIQFLRKDAAVAPTDFSDLVLIQGDRLADGSIVFDTPAPTYHYTPDFAYLVAYYPAGYSNANVNTWTIDGRTDILISSVLNTGTFSAPKTDPMVFKHQLAQLEVVCKADDSDLASEALVQYVWGKITKIELLETPTTLDYAYKTLAVAPGATKGSVSLVQKDYQADFVGVDLIKNVDNAVTAAGMFVPAVLGTTDKIRLRVYAESEPEGKEVEVQLMDGATPKGLEVGKRHTITLQFRAKDKNIQLLATEIEPWVKGYAGDGVLER